MDGVSSADARNIKRHSAHLGGHEKGFGVLFPGFDAVMMGSLFVISLSSILFNEEHLVPHPFIYVALAIYLA